MSGLRSEIVEIEALGVRNEPPSFAVAEEQEPLSKLAQITKPLLLALLVFLPIPFGAVHNSIYLPISAIIFAVAAAHLLFSRAALGSAFAPGTTSRGAMKLLLCFIAYVIAQSLYLSLVSQPHPVLGVSDGILRAGALWSGISMLGFFACTFFLARTYLIKETSFQRRVLSTILLSGVIVSLIGVSHWFYDNGKLFWVFEPDNLFVSDRARWPFVNANHLGHFLLPILFLFVAKLGDEMEQLSDYQRRHHKNDRQALSNLAHSSRLQGRLVKAGFAFCFLLAVLLAILGTLSRGTWFGLSIGIACYFFLSQTKRTESESSREAELSSRRRRSGTSSSRKRKSSFSLEVALSWLSRLTRPTFLLLAAIFIVFYFSERGTDLLAARIDYGLMYSKDDIRWQMYADTLPMIRENPIVGVGLGGWRAEYPRFMTHLLSGVDPVYLHSEPLQMLAEFGAAGAAIMLLLVIYCLKQALSALSVLRASDSGKARRLCALLCGFVGFFAASFFDFPLRMPAIVFMTAIYLALTTYYCDRALQPK